jgi:hypothetical protein
VNLGLLLVIGAAVVLLVFIFRRKRSPLPLAPISEGAVTDSQMERLRAVADQSHAFVAASMLMIDKSVLNSGTTQKVGACMYVVGAVDYLCQHYKLDDNAFLVAAREALTSFGVKDPNGFAQRIPRMAEDSFGKAAMIEGGKAIQSWLSGSDTVAPIRLFELVQGWAAKPERGFN